MHIGIFDSGIGGLTVAKEIIKAFADADVIYIGDTARVPYGPRSKEVIIQYAKEIVGYLLEKKVDVIVVACNSVSSVAMDEINKMVGNIPVVDMINPAVEEALFGTKNNKIAVIGTTATIKSNAYKKAIGKKNKQIKIYQKACPLFVPFVEEGFADSALVLPIIKHYLNSETINKADTLVLGCTHYPLLAKNIQKVIGNKVKLVSCGVPAAKKLTKIFKKSQIKNKKPILQFFVTDDPKKSQAIAKRFFGKVINIKKINI